MRIASLHRGAVLVAATGALAGVFSAPAGAATRPDFDLIPAGGGTYPQADARPGETFKSAVRIESRAERPVTIRLQATDLTTASSGGIEFSGRRPAATGRWLSLARRDVHLPANGSATVRFTVRVPQNAAAGEHYAGIIAVDRAQFERTRRLRMDGGGVRLREIARLALPVRVRLPGRARRALALDSSRFVANAGGGAVELKLRNRGRLLIRDTAIDLRVTRNGKRVFGHSASLSEFIPATHIRYRLRWPGAAPRGDYRIKGTIKPAGARAIRVDRKLTIGKAQARSLGAHTGLAVPGDDKPIMLIAVLAGTLLIALAATTAYMRLRRQMARGTTPAVSGDRGTLRSA